MDRITGRFSSGTAYVKSDGCFGGSIGHFTTQKRLPEIIDKLAEFEDFMEENGFKSLEELQKVIGFIRFSDGRDEKTGKEVHFQEFIRYADAYKDRVKAYKELYNKNRALKNRWQKLKEYIDDELELIETIKDPIEQYEYWCLEGAERTHKLIKDKMQEIENFGDKGEEI